MQEFDDAQLGTLEAGSFLVPLLRLLRVELPETEIKVGGLHYKYDRSYPVKGYGAVMPKYLAELFAAGKKPLVVERPTRFYLYVCSDSAVGASP